MDRITRPPENGKNKPISNLTFDTGHTDLIRSPSNSNNFTPSEQISHLAGLMENMTAQQNQDNISSNNESKQTSPSENQPASGGFFSRIFRCIKSFGSSVWSAIKRTTRPIRHFLRDGFKSFKNLFKSKKKINNSNLSDEESLEMVTAFLDKKFEFNCTQLLNILNILSNLSNEGKHRVIRVLVSKEAELSNAQYSHTCTLLESLLISTDQTLDTINVDENSYAWNLAKRLIVQFYLINVPR